MPPMRLIVKLLVRAQRKPRDGASQGGASRYLVGPMTERKEGRYCVLYIWLMLFVFLSITTTGAPPNMVGGSS